MVLNPGFIAIEKVDDAVDILGVCGENNVSRIMIYNSNVTDDFFDLKTQLAGNVLQKFINYSIKAVMILDEEKVQTNRFREMAMEANSGNHFRVFDNFKNAEAWLIK